MSAFNYNNTIERCRAILRQSSAAERGYRLAGFHAVSIQARTTLECLLHVSPEVDYFIQNGDRLVHATLENIKTNLDSTLHDLMRFFRSHARGSTISSHAATFSMQQRLLLLGDELSMNTHDLLSYHTRLRERMGQKDRVPLAPTQHHNVPPRQHEIRAPELVQNQTAVPISRDTSRLSRSRTPHGDQPPACRGNVQTAQEIPLRPKSSRDGPMPPRSRTPYPGEIHSREDFNHQGPPRPKSTQSAYRTVPSSQHEQGFSGQETQRRPDSTQPTRLERLSHEERSPHGIAPSNPVNNVARTHSDSQSHKMTGPVAILFVDSFNGTRSILAQACAELLRLWTLNNGSSSPFSAIDSAATRLGSSFLRDPLVRDWPLFDAADASINQGALSTLFSHADTHEQFDIKTRLSKHQPRGLIASDFEDFDFILTLDERNFSRLCYLRNRLPASRARIFLLENVHAPTSPPHDYPQQQHHHHPSGQSQDEYFEGIPNYDSLITTLNASFRTFLIAHTSWQPPMHRPFSHRYTPFRSRQFVVPVGIREPTERRIEELRRRTSCGIVVDQVVLGKEEGVQGRRVVVVSVTGREEVLRDEWDNVRRELGGWI